MDAEEIIKSLSETGKPRATIYLNQKRVHAFYEQYIGAITEIVKVKKLGGEASGSLWGFFTSKVVRGHELGEKMKIDYPIVQAMLIETAAERSDELIDLNLFEPKQGVMLKYLGPSQIIANNQKIYSAKTGLLDTQVKALEAERSRQVDILRRVDPERGAIVWVAKGLGLASVASEIWVDFGFLSSYGLFSNFGILGRYEQEVEGIVLLSPFWIWHDGY